MQYSQINSNKVEDLFIFLGKAEEAIFLRTNVNCWVYH